MVENDSIHDEYTFLFIKDNFVKEWSTKKTRLMMLPENYILGSGIQWLFHEKKPEKYLSKYKIYFKKN